MRLRLRAMRSTLPGRKAIRELARLKQERIAKATLRVSGELGIPGLKYGMDLNGYFGGPSRLPLLPLTAALKAEVEAAAGGYSKLTLKPHDNHQGHEVGQQGQQTHRRLPRTAGPGYYLNERSNYGDTSPISPHLRGRRGIRDSGPRLETRFDRRLAKILVHATERLLRKGLCCRIDARSLARERGFALRPVLLFRIQRRTAVPDPERHVHHDCGAAARAARRSRRSGARGFALSSSTIWSIFSPIRKP